MATLAQLRRKVQSRLRDWGGDQWEEFELNQILNEAQDQFTRDTGYLRTVIEQNMLDGASVYTLSAPAGYRINETLSVIYFDGVRDYPALIPVSLRQLELMSPDYRHVSGSVPMYYIRNFNPDTGLPSNDTFYLYPTPDLNYSTYSGTWPLVFTGGGGSNAAGTATFTNGVVTGTTITNAGSGYTSAPTVTLATSYNGYKFVSGSGASFTATGFNGNVTSLSIISGGSNIYRTSSGSIDINPYTGTWGLTFSGGDPDVVATGTAYLSNGIVTNLNLTQGGNSYSSSPSVTLASSYLGYNWVSISGNDPSFSASVGTAEISITTAGSNYTATNKRLRVNVTLTTDGQMTTDDTEMALPERVAEEALINYTVAEALMRECMAIPDKADLFMKQVEYYRSKYLDRMVRAAAEAKSGFDRGMNTTRGWWV
jgi:hypothetical protein